jgi:hypothetical protein
MNKDLYIFDLDGTIAKIDHRRHFVEDKKNQRWDEFSRACVDDEPNKPVIKIFSLLYNNDCDIYIWSGRSALVFKETVVWLRENIGLSYDVIFKILKMRSHGDTTQDTVLKQRWYENLIQYDKERLVCIFDDRQTVVDMWRSLGLTCLQVAPGTRTKWK